MTLIESLRAQVTNHSLKRKKWFQKHWRTVRPQLLKHLHSPITHSTIIALGSQLGEIFSSQGDRRAGDALTTSEANRIKATAGYGWEDLICYYINLVYLSTNAIALTKKYVPGLIKELLAVNFSGTNIDADIDLVIVCNSEWGSLPAPAHASDKVTLKHVESHLHQTLDKTALILVQAKTNWNDTMQSAVLWNIVYKAATTVGLDKMGLTVGRSDSHLLKELGYFGYSLITVPSNKSAFNFNRDNVPVRRAHTMSAGHYWGYEGKSGIADSISSLFGKGYQLSGELFPEPAQCGRAAADFLSRSDNSPLFAPFNLLD
jgi:hypothetical protein